MKRVLFTTAMAVCFWGGVLAQEISFFDAKLTDAGTLKTIIGEKANEIDSLVVSGPVNGADFRTMWECSHFGKTTVLNLENAEVVGNKIPDQAFVDLAYQYGDKQYLNLRRVILPDNLEEIGQSAFSRTKIETINIPTSLKKLGMGAFQNCCWLSSPLILPEGIEVIPSFCFEGCLALTDFSFPSSLKSIGEFAFSRTSMNELVLPEGLETIDKNAFYGVYNATKLTLPSSLIELGEMAFSTWYDLKEVYINDGLTALPSNCFQGSICLEAVRLPGTLQTIGREAFDQTALTAVELPDGLKSIERDAFSGTKLTKIFLPASVERLEPHIFLNVELSEIYSASPNPPTCIDLDGQQKTPWGTLSGLTPVYIPTGSTLKYIEAYGWRQFTNYIEMDFPSAGVEDTVIMEDAFCLVYTPDGKLAFEGKRSELNLPSGLYILKSNNSAQKIYVK